mgnify:CR=1 FL=1
MKKTLFLLVLFFSSSLFAKDEFIGKKFLCDKLLWGFEFISSQQVNVISTNINNKTNVKKYYYDIDFDLRYINLYLDNQNTENAVFSIHLDTFRVDVWTMTSGGITTREIIPKGFCDITNINNILAHIESLKIYN